MTEAAACPVEETEPKPKNGSGGASTSNNVYIMDKQFGWMPARLLESSDTSAVVSIPTYPDEASILTDGGQGATSWRQETIELKKYPNQTLPLQNVNKSGMLTQKDDMVDLAFLHEAAILYNLKGRHVDAKPYTRTGDIVIAVNPYQWLSALYTEQQQLDYAQTLVWKARSGDDDPRRDLSPHVYEASALAYRGLACDGVDQSILVSGESGAGKTETVKICMNHIAIVQRGPSRPEGVSSNKRPPQQQRRASLTAAAATGLNKVVQRVVESNPLLEAFGNAKTRRNDNSSRFGKYVQLQFDRDDTPQENDEPVKKNAPGAKEPKKVGVKALMEEEEKPKEKPLARCILAGSKCEVYLLEKSRVVGHDPTERTFHIFYAIIAASDQDKSKIWKGLLGKDNASFKYVGQTNWQEWDGTPDSEHYSLTSDNLALIGVTGDKLTSLMRAITVVLQLGQITFCNTEGDAEKAAVQDKEEFEGLSELIGIPAAALEKAFTEKTMVTRGETFVVPLKPDEAKGSCDAFAKEIYSKVFLWLVREINAATCAEDNYDGERKDGFRTIGLLDIFGFESFPVNGFEQLCINYANEKLQAKFTKDIFVTVQEEYRAEGISLKDIRYDDNTDVLNLIESRTGVMALLNEACVRPKGSAREFVYKVRNQHKKAFCLIPDKHEGKLLSPVEFGIHHYAGKVIYYTEGFLQRNQDTIAPDLYKIAEESTNEIISKHLRNESTSKGSDTKVESPGGGAGRRQKSNMVGNTLWNKFKSQLSSLMRSLSETQSRYIRCVKPNAMKKPLVMQHMTTIEQLRCAGVVAAVTITRSAFPNRLDHKACYERYKMLDRPEKPFRKKKGDIDIKEELSKILGKALVDYQGEDVFVIGKTRAYFRAGVLEYLENMRMESWDLWAIDIERVARGWFVRRIARAIRMKKFQEMFASKGEHAIPIQTRWRVVLAKKELKKAKFEKLRGMAKRLELKGPSSPEKAKRKPGKLKINPLWK